MTAPPAWSMQWQASESRCCCRARVRGGPLCASGESGAAGTAQKGGTAEQLGELGRVFPSPLCPEPQTSNLPKRKTYICAPCVLLQAALEAEMARGKELRRRMQLAHQKAGGSRSRNPRGALRRPRGPRGMPRGQHLQGQEGEGRERGRCCLCGTAGPSPWPGRGGG